MKNNSVVNKVVLGLALAVVSVPASYLLYEGISLVSDLAFSIPEEKKIEEEISVPLYFKILEQDEKRLENLIDFKKAYDIARDNWDNFDQQMAKVEKINIKTNFIKQIHSATMSRYGEFGLTSLSHRNFPHELAHRWQLYQNYLTRGDFDDGLNELIGHYNFKDDWTKDDMQNIGCVEGYGMTNIREFVATACGFVYEVNHSNIGIIGFPNEVPSWKTREEGYYSLGGHDLSKEKVPQLINVLKYLQDHDFFSKRELGQTVSELKGFAEGVE